MSSRYFELFGGRRADAKRIELNASSSGAAAAASVDEGVKCAPTTLPQVPPYDLGSLRQPEHGRREILQLVHRIFLVPRPSGSLRLVLMSSIGGGKAENVSAWAAEMLAVSAKGSVCLVDANTQAPIIHEFFGISADAGFSDYICSPGSGNNSASPFAFQVGDSNLWMMPAGSRRSEVSATSIELLVAAMVGLRSSFDYVIVNAPLAEKQVISIALAPLGDGVVLVINAGDTRREIVMRTKNELESAHAPVLGAVLHNRRFPVPNFLYKRLF